MKNTTNRIKWIEDKTEDFRGNWTQFAFKLDNSPFTFEWNSYMTYKSFRSATRSLAQKYGAKIITICEPFQGTQQEHVDAPEQLIVGSLNDNRYWLYKELVVPAGTRRQMKESEEATVFPK